MPAAAAVAGAVAVWDAWLPDLNHRTYMWLNLLLLAHVGLQTQVAKLNWLAGLWGWSVGAFTDRWLPAPLSDLLGAQVRLQGLSPAIGGGKAKLCGELFVAGQRDPGEGLGWIYSGLRDPGHHGGQVAARAQWQPAPVAAGLLQLGLRMCGLQELRKHAATFTKPQHIVLPVPVLTG